MNPCYVVTACRPAAELASFWNKPIVTWVATDLPVWHSLTWHTWSPGWLLTYLCDNHSPGTPGHLGSYWPTCATITHLTHLVTWVATDLPAWHSLTWHTWSPGWLLTYLRDTHSPGTPGHLGGYWPTCVTLTHLTHLVTWVATHPDFNDKSVFTTLGRTLGPFNKMGTFPAKVSRHVDVNYSAKVATSQQNGDIPVGNL